MVRQAGWDPAGLDALLKNMGETGVQKFGGENGVRSKINLEAFGAGKTDEVPNRVAAVRELLEHLSETFSLVTLTWTPTSLMMLLHKLIHLWRRYLMLWWLKRINLSL